MSLADLVRAEFPVFERRFQGVAPAPFDGPGGSQVPRPVIDAVAGYLACHNANTHGPFPTSRETDAIISEARAELANFLNAPSASEVVFGANMTTLAFALSRSLSRDWRPGDEVVVTELDHQANVAPWRTAAETAGVRVRTVPFSRDTFQLDWDALEAVLGPRTRLLAIGAASNAVGTVNDVRRAAGLARAAGALCFVDAVHLAPHFVVDVQRIGCDFLACSAYKFFGPHLGILWGRSELLDRLPAFKVPPASDAAPERWETGTQQHALIAGAGAAVRWIASLGKGSGREATVRGMERIGAHETAQLGALLEGLGGIEAVRIYGPAAGAPRTPTVSFTVGEMHAEDVAERLAQRGVWVWSGDFYASGVIDALGLRERGGLVRAGVAPYTSGNDVRRLVEGVREIAAGE